MKEIRKDLERKSWQELKDIVERDRQAAISKLIHKDCDKARGRISYCEKILAFWDEEQKPTKPIEFV